MTSLNQFALKKSVNISLAEGFFGGLILTFISTMNFEYHAIRGLTILAVYIAIVTINLILIAFLLPYLPYIKRVRYGLISFVAANVPFLIFETIYSPFAYHKSFWDITSVLSQLTGIGLIISLFFSIFVRRKKA
jgi:hypothetical protein